MPSESAAMPMRPESSVFMKLTKPSPSRAEQILGGHFDVLEDQLGGVRRAPAQLVLLLAGAESAHRRAARARGRCRDRVTFSRSDVGFVTMKELIPFVPADGSVTAVTTKISPTLPCVMNRLVPLRT